MKAVNKEKELLRSVDVLIYCNPGNFSKLINLVN